MAIVNDDGVHETELDAILPKAQNGVIVPNENIDNNVVSPAEVEQKKNLEAIDFKELGGIDVGFQSVDWNNIRRVNIEDRREEPNPNEPKWENVLPSLGRLAEVAGRNLGVIPTPDLPEVPATKLGVEAGLEDIAIEKKIDSRSLLDRAIDDLVDGSQLFINIYRAAIGKDPIRLGSDKPFSEVEFSKGLLNRDAPIGRTELAKQVEDFKVKASQPADLKITPENIEQAINVGMGAGPGTMAGVKAATVSKPALYLAAESEMQGFNRDAIYKGTGFFKGADDLWRFEIDDSVAKLNTKWADNPTPTQRQTGTKTVKLSEVLDHPELFKAYPKLKDFQVTYDNNFKGIAEFSGENIRVGRYPLNPGDPPAYLDKSIILHEVQHAIQNIEGFAKGGSPARVERGDYRLKYEQDVRDLAPKINDIITKLEQGKQLTDKETVDLARYRKILQKYDEYVKAGDDRAFQNYESLAGEVEARNVQTRMNLTAEERARFHPEDTEDIARSKQLSRQSPTLTTPYFIEGDHHTY